MIMMMSSRPGGPPGPAARARRHWRRPPLTRPAAAEPGCQPDQADSRVTLDCTTAAPAAASGCRGPAATEPPEHGARHPDRRAGPRRPPLPGRAQPPPQ